MRFQIETARDKAIRVRQWHRWFAWYPVLVNAREFRWLEFIEARVGSHGWEYR